MTFDENGICQLESITSPDECDAYAYFLKDERDRHLEVLRDAENDAAWYQGPGDRLPPHMTLTTRVYRRALARFWESAATRHQQDIDAIDRLLPKIQAHKEKLEGKHD